MTRADQPGAGAADQRLGVALAHEQRAGTRLAIFTRLGALAVIAIWVVARVPGEASLYYLGIIVALALLGLGQVVVGRSGASWAMAATYLLILLDMGVLTFALIVPNPLASAEWPAAMQLRLGNFDFFYIFMGFAVLGFSPGLALWAGIAVAVAWSLGVLWVLAQQEYFTVLGANLIEGGDVGAMLEVMLDPNYVSFEIWVQEVIIALVVAGILALSVWRSRRLAIREATAARERANLARYFSPRRAAELAQSPAAMALVRQQPIAVLFADIIGFTRMAEQSSPEAVIGLLREFHQRMAAAVFAHDGTLEKYIGDAVMATFGTPVTTGRDAANALDCGQAMLASVAAWNDSRRDHGLTPIRIAVGAHFGEAVLGDVGDARCMEFAVLGDTVNVAARLEQLCRELGVDFVVSDHLIAEIPAPDRATRLTGFAPGEPQTLRGREQPLPIWTR